jgi:N-acetylglucosaminyldiphosphoundecaprenol N-acetyl-beta-D-mannosaminyltransferase
VSDPRPGPATYRILGVTVNAIDVDTLFGLIEDAVRSERPCVIANHNLHSIYLYHSEMKMRRFYHHARYVFVDGTPIIYLGQLLGYPLGYQHRITSIHWIRPLLSLAVEKGWRTFFLGGKPGTAAAAARILAAEIPGAQIETADGFFDATPGSAEGEAVLARIARYRPHILCVAMGMPRQEHWIIDHVDRIEAPVTLNLGGFMELVTGDLPTPPRWVGRANLEWLFRLATRPKRVWRRYLMEPWFLLPWLARDVKESVRRRSGEVPHRKH